jgi:hypothetical protein
VQNVSTPAGSAQIKIFGAGDTMSPDPPWWICVGKLPKEKTGKYEFYSVFLQ